jgi:hypothetical protein
MSMGPLGGVIGSAAGAPLSQTAGSEAERTQKESVTQQRQVDTEQRAADAAGVGHTEEDQHAEDRDADGRRLWEAPPEPRKDNDAAGSADTTPHKAKDATGQCGSHLDLTG